MAENNNQTNANKVLFSFLKNAETILVGLVAAGLIWLISSVYQIQITQAQLYAKIDSMTFIFSDSKSRIDEALELSRKNQRQIELLDQRVRDKAKWKSEN